MEHELDYLEDLIEGLGLDPTNKQIEELHEVFINDFENEPFFLNDVRVKYNKKASKHPLFKGKPEGFEHVCTRKSDHSNRRYFEYQRANKISWIKPVVTHHNNNRIKYFERKHFNGQNQKHFWYEALDYVVIIREISKELILVTAFVVDFHKKKSFEKWYREYLK